MIDWQRRAKAMHRQAGMARQEQRHWYESYRLIREIHIERLDQCIDLICQIRRLQREKEDLVRFIALQDQAIEDCKRRHGGTA